MQTKKIKSRFKVLERWGCGGRKASFKKFSSPTKINLTNKGEPPTRVLPLPLRAKEFTLSCVL